MDQQKLSPTGYPTPSNQPLPPPPPKRKSRVGGVTAVILVIIAVRALSLALSDSEDPPLSQRLDTLTAETEALNTEFYASTRRVDTALVQLVAVVEDQTLFNHQAFLLLEEIASSQKIQADFSSLSNRFRELPLSGDNAQLLQSFLDAARPMLAWNSRYNDRLTQFANLATYIDPLDEFDPDTDRFWDLFLDLVTLEEESQILFEEYLSALSSLSIPTQELEAADAEHARYLDDVIETYFPEP